MCAHDMQHSPLTYTMPRQAPISATHPASQHVVTNGRAVERQLSVVGSHRLRDKRQAPSRPRSNCPAYGFPELSNFLHVFIFETIDLVINIAAMARGWRLCGSVPLSIVLAIAPYVSCICEPGPARRDWSSVKGRAPHAFVHPGVSCIAYAFTASGRPLQCMHPCMHCRQLEECTRMVHAGVQRVRLDDALHDRHPVQAWS